MTTNWAGNFTYAATEVRRPRTVAELQDVVAAADRVKALGSRHSFSRVADTTGVLVSTAELGLPIEVRDDTVVVPAGLRYSQVIPALAAARRALPNLGSLPHISVAGAAATGTHGSGSRNRNVSAGVVAIEFVRADGELVTIGEGDADFAGSVLALGALGVVTRLTVRTLPEYDLRQYVWRDAPIDAVRESLDEIMDSAYSISMFRRPGGSVVDQIWVKAAADVEAPDGRRWGATAATVPMHPIDGQDTAAASPQLGQRRAWHEVLPHFRASFTPSSGEELQSEYFVAREHAAGALSAMLRLSLDHLVQVMEFRTVAADELWLSPARGRNSFALHITWVDDEPAVRHACAQLESALAEFRPRPHWGKVFSMSRDEVRAVHPTLVRFAELAARLDPNRTFGNDYLTEFVY